MKKYLAFFFVILIGCKPIEPVEFDEIKNVQLDNLADNKIKISADIVLNNPNKAKITVTYIDLNIIADGIPLVNINDNLNKELTGENKSTLNIIGDINVKNLEKFLNQNGIAILLGSDKTQLKFIFLSTRLLIKYIFYSLNTVGSRSNTEPQASR